MSSKRQSILSAVDRSGPKPPVNFSSSLTISGNAVLKGTHSITIQAETVIHPRCRIESNLGSVLIGRRCIVHERVYIGAQPADLDKAKPGGVALGEYVVVEVGAIIEAGNTEIGDGSTIHVGCKIRSGAKIGKVRRYARPKLHISSSNAQLLTFDNQNCTISHLSEISPGEVLPDNTVVYANGKRRIDRRGITDMRKSGLLKQLTVLKAMIPSNAESFK